MLQRNTCELRRPISTVTSCFVDAAVVYLRMKKGVPGISVSENGNKRIKGYALWWLCTYISRYKFRVIWNCADLQRVKGIQRCRILWEFLELRTLGVNTSTPRCWQHRILRIAALGRCVRICCVSRATLLWFSLTENTDSWIQRIHKSIHAFS